MSIKDTMYWIALVFELSGVATIVVGFVLAILRALDQARAKRRRNAYAAMRQTFGRSILLGLEILVAADLIRTVAIEATLENLAVLAALVVIRTFLSWTLEVEIDGHWPWQRDSRDWAQYE